jgi:opacity protein-like surface antigen
MAAMAVLGTFAAAGGDIAPVATPVTEEVVSSNFYAGLALSAVSTRDAAVSLDIFDGKAGQDRLGNLTFLAGYKFNEYIALEGRYTTTIVDDDSVEMDGWSIFVKPQYPINEAFTVYALLGFGGISMDPTTLKYVDVDDNGFQWGLGASYDFTENISIFADYTSLANEMDGIYWNGALEVDVDTFNVGVLYNF